MTNDFPISDQAHPDPFTGGADPFAGARSEAFDLMKSQSTGSGAITLAAADVPVVKILPPGPRPDPDWRDGVLGGPFEYSYKETRLPKVGTLKPPGSQK